MEVKINTNPEDGAIEVRTGAALELKNPNSVVISGSIDTPLNFAKRRMELIAAKEMDSHVVVNMKKKTIVLFVDEKNPFDFYKITGTLKLSDHIGSINLNGSKMTRTELIQTLKKHKYFFPDKDEFSKVLESIEKFSVKIQKLIEQSSEKNGNSNSLLNYSTSWGDGLNNKFKIKVPIFDGHEPKVMQVEIGLDPTDATVRFYLDSDDFHEIVVAETERIIGESILYFEENTTLPVLFE